MARAHSVHWLSAIKGIVERVICSLHFKFLLLQLHSLKEIEFCLLEMSFISNQSGNGLLN